MSYAGHLIHQQKDAWGDIRVLDKGGQTVLSFGPGDEQGACTKSKPGVFCFDYIQAMLLPLLWTPPKKVLSLGLGAGSLVTGLHTHFKMSKITAVELRPAIIEVAHTYFGLPQSKRVTLHCEDAFVFMATNKAQYDLVFSDLYLFSGMIPRQLEINYLRDCLNALKPQGTLVLNCWKEQGQAEALEHTLSQILKQCVNRCSLIDGNDIFYVSKGPIPLGQKALEKSAQQFGQKMGVPFRQYLKRMY